MIGCKTSHFWKYGEKVPCLIKVNYDVYLTKLAFMKVADFYLNLDYVIDWFEYWMILNCLYYFHFFRNFHLGKKLTNT